MAKVFEKVVGSREKKQQGCTRQCSNDNLIIFLTSVQLHLAEERKAIVKFKVKTYTDDSLVLPTKKSTKNV